MSPSFTKVSVEVVLTTLPVSSAAVGRLFLELAARTPSVVVPTVTIPFHTSATVAMSS